MACVNKNEYSKICRLCTSTLGQGPYHIFDEDFSHQLLRKIQDCLPIKVTEKDNLPKSVCEECFKKLDNFHSFRESCRKTARLLEGNEIQSQVVKMEEEGNDNSGDGELVICEIDENLETNGDTVHSDDDNGDLMHVQTLMGIDKVKKLPELAEPCSDDYVLMKEETFEIDSKDTKGGGSNILADYLVEFNNNSQDRDAMKDKDIFESQKLRREILPPMWDVYEKTIGNKENDGKFCESTIKVTHRRYIVSKGAFPCSLCGECFEFDQGRGRDELEDKARLFDCHVCGKVFPRRSSWKRHQSTHEDMKPYLCRICGFGFNRREHLSRHLFSHTNTKPFNCEGCGKLFTRKEHLARHHLCSPSCLTNDMKDTLRPFCCEVCNHGFVRKEHLIRHRKKNHDLDPTDGTEPKPFACDVCHKNFTRREHLRRHQIIHTRELLLNSSSFSSSQGIQIKNEKPFNSEVSMFPVFLNQSKSSAPPKSPSVDVANINDVKIENESLDLKEESDCDGDDDSFMPPLPQVSLEVDETETSLVSTSLVTTSVVTPSASALIPISNPPVPISVPNSKTMCHICHKNFSRRSHLSRHLRRIHHVEIPTRNRKKREAPGPGDENGNSLVNEENIIQNCEICGRTFTKRYLLERHREQQHGGEIARYECVTCGQKFVESHLLDEHMAVHGNTICDNFIWM